MNRTTGTEWMSLGERLKQRREEEGLTIDEIAARTYIRAGHLTALEKGEYHLLPPSRVRYFIRDYARVLGLDPEPLLADLPEDLSPPKIPTSTPTDPAPEEGKTKRRPLSTVPPPKETPRKEKPSEKSEEKEKEGEKKSRVFPPVVGRRRAPRYSPLDQGNPMLARGLIGVALVLILGLGVWYLFFSDDGEAEEGVTLVSDTAADSPIRIIGDEGDIDESDTATAETVPAGDSLVLRGVFTGRAWYSIAMDGNREDQGTLDSGEVREWRATEYFSISLGNAGGVRFSINGKEVGTLGPRGGTVRGRIINAEGLQGGPTTTPSEQRRSRPRRSRPRTQEEPRSNVPELTPSEPRTD